MRIFLSPAGILLAALLIGCGGAGDEEVPASLAQLTPAGVRPFTGNPQFDFPTPLAQPTIEALGEEIDFNHPGGEVRWSGPSDRVSTSGNNLCDAPTGLKEAFRLPAVVIVRENPGSRGYFAEGLEVRQDDWVWTGYYHGDWQLWQSSRPATVYVVHSNQPNVGFSYRAHGCY